MPDLPVLFSESAADRIGAATRWAELQQGMPVDGYAPSPGNALCLVRTGTTLPVGYTGAMAVLGDVVEKQSDNTVNTLGQVWIKDVNGGTLSANTIYQARPGGIFTQDVTVNSIVTPTTYGLYVVNSAGSAETVLYLRAWRYAIISAELKDKTKTYALCTIFAENNPDTTDVDIYITTAGLFTYRTDIKTSTLSTVKSSYPLAGLFNIFSVDKKTDYNFSDIEYLPFEIFSLYVHGFICKKSDFYELKDYNSNNHIGSNYYFTRKIKKNKDGSDINVPVNMIAINESQMMVPYITDGLEPIDQYGNFLKTYIPNTKYSKYLGTSLSYRIPGPDGNYGINATGPVSTVVLSCDDPFGLGYPSALLGTKIKYFCFPGISTTILPFQVGQLPNSPMYVPPTTGGISTGIGPGISGV